MEIQSQIKLVKHIFRLLKVQEITFPIGRTNKGNLGLKFTQNSEDFEMMLDAVPLRTTNFLEDENNIELKKMIEKYWFNEHNVTYTYTGTDTTITIPHNDTPPKLLVEDTKNVVIEPKKKGRPKGSKNK